ncbi:MAG: DNA gyrase inhibitor YacG [Pseudomonadota bacterium]
MNERNAKKRCPTCGKPAASDHKPFCSKRCQEVDLNRWLGGHYAIPVEDPEVGALSMNDNAEKSD